MGDDVAIAVQHVSKKFELFRSPLDRLLQGLGLRQRRPARFWALRDVSFDVPRGATVGILGRNGSGKSTLLQIIYGVLQPTSGRVAHRGTMAALLELGAGFNPAFTGRANIHLHGATRGWSQRETKARLPQIEAFAEIGPFIDEPVKNYSSGMFVRLAFAAAVSDEPDVFIVDEALAVGDARFQHRCYQKLLDFQRAGKTVVLVTHDTQAVVKHCQHALLLEQGRLIAQGEPRAIVNQYLELLFTGTVNGYQPVPRCVRRGYRGFSIVHYGTKYYALAEALGPIDLAQAEEQDLERLVQERHCAVAESAQAARLLVDRIAFSAGERAQQPAEPPAAETEAAVDPVARFLQGPADPAGCGRHPSYNRNEHRFGDHRAEIVDYLLVDADGTEVSTVTSGEAVDIYVKARFHEAVELPLVGFALKTVDGLLLYGTNTRMSQVPLQPAGCGDVIVVQFRFQLPLNPGDVFIDLGVAEDRGSEHVPLDVRYDLIHLSVQEKVPFSGLVNLGATVREVNRAGAAGREAFVGASAVSTVVE